MPNIDMLKVIVIKLLTLNRYLYAMQKYYKFTSCNKAGGSVTWSKHIPT